MRVRGKSDIKNKKQIIINIKRKIVPEKKKEKKKLLTQGKC